MHSSRYVKSEINGRVARPVIKFCCYSWACARSAVPPYLSILCFRQTVCSLFSILHTQDELTLTFICTRVSLYPLLVCTAFQHFNHKQQQSFEKFLKLPRIWPIRSYFIHPISTCVVLQWNEPLLMVFYIKITWSIRENWFLKIRY